MQCPSHRPIRDDLESAANKARNLRLLDEESSLLHAEVMQDIYNIMAQMDAVDISGIVDEIKEGLKALGHQGSRWR